MNQFWNDGTELYHYGILGQKWGLRRWQNDDGSFNEQGKIRYGRIGSGRNRDSQTSNSLRKQKQYEPINVDKNKIKTAATIGLAAAGAVIAVYGAKQIYENYTAVREFDPVTGLPLKPFGHTLENDIKHQNPGAIYIPGFGVISVVRGSTSNCALNTLNIEMNRRGYDTYPGLSTDGLSSGQIFSMWKKDGVNIWQESNIANELKHIFSSSEYDFDEIERDILATFPEGSRGNLNFYYGALSILPIPQNLKGKLFGSGLFEDIPIGGHSVAWEIENGKVVVRDGQIGLVRSSLKKHLRGAILDDSMGIEMFRYDNLEPDLEYINKNNFLRTDNNTKFIVDNLYKVPFSIISDPNSISTLLGIASSGYLVKDIPKNLNKQVKKIRGKKKYAKAIKTSNR